MGYTFEVKKQVLNYLERMGFASIVFCDDGGETYLECKTPSERWLRHDGEMKDIIGYLFETKNEPYTVDDLRHNLAMELLEDPRKAEGEMTPEQFLNKLEQDGFTDISIVFRNYGYGYYELKATNWKEDRSMSTGIRSLTPDLFPHTDEYYSIPYIRHNLEMKKKRMLEWEMPYSDMTEEDVLNHFESMNYKGIIYVSGEEYSEMMLRKSDGKLQKHSGPMERIISNLPLECDVQYSFEELRDALAIKQREEEQEQDYDLGMML